MAASHPTQNWLKVGTVISLSGLYDEKNASVCLSANASLSGAAMMDRNHLTLSVSFKSSVSELSIF